MWVAVWRGLCPSRHYTLISQQPNVMYTRPGATGQAAMHRQWTLTASVSGLGSEPVAGRVFTTQRTIMALFEGGTVCIGHSNENMSR